MFDKEAVGILDLVDTAAKMRALGATTAQIAQKFGRTSGELLRKYFIGPAQVRKAQRLGIPRAQALSGQKATAVSDWGLGGAPAVGNQLATAGRDAALGPNPINMAAYRAAADAERKARGFVKNY